MLIFFFHAVFYIASVVVLLASGIISLIHIATICFARHILYRGNLYERLARTHALTSSHHQQSENALESASSRSQPVLPFVSVVKPVKGVDDGNLRTNLHSYFHLDYPGGYELLFAVEDAADPCLHVINKLIAQHEGGFGRRNSSGNASPHLISCRVFIRDTHNAQTEKAAANHKRSFANLDSANNVAVANGGSHVTNVSVTTEKGEAAAISEIKLGANPKINNLFEAYSAARGPLVLMADSAIYFRPDTLLDMALHILDERVGLVHQMPFIKPQNNKAPGFSISCIYSSAAAAAHHAHNYSMPPSLLAAAPLSVQHHPLHHRHNTHNMNHNRQYHQKDEPRSQFPFYSSNVAAAVSKSNHSHQYDGGDATRSSVKPTNFETSILIDCGGDGDGDGDSRDDRRAGNEADMNDGSNQEDGSVGGGCGGGDISSSSSSSNGGTVTSFFSAPPSFGNVYELVYFGCWFAKIYLSAAMFQINSLTGMSLLIKKRLLEPAALAKVSDYLAEDFFIGEHVLRQGYRLALAGQPAWQNSAPANPADLLAAAKSSSPAFSKKVDSKHLRRASLTHEKFDDCVDSVTSPCSPLSTTTTQLSPSSTTTTTTPSSSSSKAVKLSLWGRLKQRLSRCSRVSSSSSLLLPASPLRSAPLSSALDTLPRLPPDVNSFRQRQIRWAQMRLFMVPLKFVFEPFTDSIAQSLMLSVAVAYLQLHHPHSAVLSCVNPLALVLCHLLLWFLCDYLLFVHIVPPPHYYTHANTALPIPPSSSSTASSSSLSASSLSNSSTSRFEFFSRVDFLFAWLFRELTAFSIQLSAYSRRRRVQWRNRCFLLRFGGKVRLNTHTHTNTHTPVTQPDMNSKTSPPLVIAPPHSNDVTHKHSETLTMAAAAAEAERGRMTSPEIMAPQQPRRGGTIVTSSSFSLAPSNSPALSQSQQYDQQQLHHQARRPPLIRQSPPSSASHRQLLHHHHHHHHQASASDVTHSQISRLQHHNQHHQNHQQHHHINSIASSPHTHDHTDRP